MPMKLIRALAPCLLACFLGNAAPAYAQKNVDELTSAVAAASVLAFRCEPGRYEAVRDQAFREMYERMRLYSRDDQMLAYDSAERKLKAFSISSSAETCPGFERLRSVAATFGYSHLIVPAAVPSASSQ